MPKLQTMLAQSHHGVAARAKGHIAGLSSGLHMSPSHHSQVPDSKSSGEVYSQGQFQARQLENVNAAPGKSIAHKYLSMAWSYARCVSVGSKEVFGVPQTRLRGYCKLRLGRTTVMYGLPFYFLSFPFYLRRSLQGEAKVADEGTDIIQKALIEEERDYPT